MAVRIRVWPAFYTLLFVFAASVLHGQVRINELQSTRAEGSQGVGADGDWVELYNAGGTAVDLGGYILSLDGQLERFPRGLLLGAGQCRAWWCGTELSADSVRLGFKLPRKGGALLLVAPDRTTILDVFHWPELPAGVSIGRRIDGARAWGYFAKPTPGSTNTGAVSRLLSAPIIRPQGEGVAVIASEGATVHYTLDGTVPNTGSAVYQGPLRLNPGTVISASAFALDAVPGPLSRYTVGVPDGGWALALSPPDLIGPLGIADAASGNYARKGRDWERQAWLQHGDQVSRVGLAIAGSGSRSLPKRNFKLRVRNRFGGDNPVLLPDGSSWREVLLRADATPHAFLRNLFMETVARQSGGRVDVQPSFPVAVYLNGVDQGLYRAMPAKGAEWVRTLNGDAPVDLVEGPSGRAVSGSPKQYLRLLKAVSGGQRMDSLTQDVDISSLVELACFDVWTGRADHELNVRCWRPRAIGGRWRWVMYDMDQWAAPEERTVQRMCGAALPETPFLTQLLATPGSRALFLARLSALMATTLGEERAGKTADSLYACHRKLLLHDMGLWKGQMEAPGPETSLADLQRHVQSRNRNLLEQLSTYTGLAVRRVVVQVEPAGAGRVSVEDLMLAGPYDEIKGFSSVPLHLQAVASAGMEFVGWKGVESSGGRLVLAPMRDMRLTAVFRPVALSRQGGLQQRME